MQIYEIFKVFKFVSIKKHYTYVMTEQFSLEQSVRPTGVNKSDLPRDFIFADLPCIHRGDAKIFGFCFFPREKTMFSSAKN